MVCARRFPPAQARNREENSIAICLLHGVLVDRRAHGRARRNRLISTCGADFANLRLTRMHPDRFACRG
jgi:hypothetical protein